MTTKFKILSSISFIALAIVLTFVGVWELTDLDFAVGGNITYTAPAPEPVTPEEVSYLTFEYDTTNYTAKLTACSSSAPETVEIPSQIVKDGKTYTVTSIAEGYWDEMEYEGEGLFYGTSVKELAIPDTVTEIGQNAFVFCEFEKVIVGNGVKEATKAFLTADITNLIFKEGIIKIPDYTAYEGFIKNVTFPSSVKEIGIAAFSFCKDLQTALIPEGVEIIGFDAFNFCNSLTSITLPSTVTIIDGFGFYSCSKLSIIEVKAITPPTIDDKTFAECSSLTTINVPSASLEAYKTADVWSSYANIMVGV